MHAWVAALAWQAAWRDAMHRSSQSVLPTRERIAMNGRSVPLPAVLHASTQFQKYTYGGSVSTRSTRVVLRRFTEHLAFAPATALALDATMSFFFYQSTPFHNSIKFSPTSLPFIHNVIGEAVLPNNISKIAQLHLESCYF
jgi:hypothetical protein